MFDFICLSKKIVINVNGYAHNDCYEKDKDMFYY
ncbi:MAG: hypothetical protein JXA77_11560 [Bacteroidales bacterium]|nr:hypothetical protein [Bacteroidales bacterium]